ncbi:asparaginase domain-containing protein [Porticoccus sp. W117]|uniref:asparaginase domain-containing protein n=1 Tax=Porticoccus sp. W117 TaxID=3054777 RepID=UPI00259A8665|nr:asparaginase domain-containing protein [Porticoccus sp. W117]MDM3869948.1 asparaginase domain-containing protein [Porticoccus sp. W117]
MKINIITTGGTIDKIYFDAKSDYQVGDPVIGELLKRMEVGFEFEVTSVLRKDSLDLTDDDRQLIVDQVKNCDSDYVLVTHGTDGMVETGKWLREQVPEKHILMTGALQPAIFRETDAIFNIGCALGALQAVQPGVYIAMNGQLFDATRVVKNVAANRFEPVNP